MLTAQSGHRIFAPMRWRIPQFESAKQFYLPLKTAKMCGQQNQFL
jgi:hypothetical protein